MVLTAEVSRLFDDARQMQQAALDQLKAGDIRDSAEKSWCATKQASAALVLALNPGAHINTTKQVSRGMKLLSRDTLGRLDLSPQYSHRIHVLHADCFYDGDCEPRDEVAAIIRGTDAYIEEAERLALFGLPS